MPVNGASTEKPYVSPAVPAWTLCSDGPERKRAGPGSPWGELPPDGSRAEKLCHQQSAVRSFSCSEDVSRAFSASGPLFLECVFLTFGQIIAFLKCYIFKLCIIFFGLSRPVSLLLTDWVSVSAGP